MKHSRLSLVLPLLLACAANAQQGQPEMTAPPRDPGSVPLPASVALELRLGSRAPLERFGAAFDRIAPSGEIPVIGSATTLQIRAAADRARVFLAYTQYDLDGDGQVSRAEYDAHAELSWGDTLGEREYKMLDEEWTRADANGDGLITHSEILGLALKLHPVPDTGPLGPEAQAMLKMDLDNDGYVTWPEVEAVLSAPR